MNLLYFAIALLAVALMCSLIVALKQPKNEKLPPVEEIVVIPEEMIIKPIKKRRQESRQRRKT